MILLRGGWVVGASALRQADLVIEGDQVVAMEEGLRVRADHTVEAGGCLVGPGFVDLHTHMRDPGQTWKEDLESGSRSAAAGGFTAVVAMPNTDPPIDDVNVAVDVMTRADELGVVKVMAAGALTEGRAGLAPSDIASLYEAGVRLFTDDGDTVEDESVLTHVMSRIAALPGAVLAQHAEPEESIVSRDLAIAGSTGARYHVQHVSAGATVELVRRARARGTRVSAEVTPHHLWFTDSDAGGSDPNFQMYPPLRPDADRAHLQKAALSGAIDCLATDHAPHLPSEKSVPFVDAPRGVIGLETAAAAFWSLGPTPSRLFDSMSARPARLAGLDRHGLWPSVGSPANLVVFDPEHRWAPRTFVSKSSNSPFLGVELTGWVTATIHEGRLTHEVRG